MQQFSAGAPRDLRHRGQQAPLHPALPEAHEGRGRHGGLRAQVPLPAGRRKGADLQHHRPRSSRRASCRWTSARSCSTAPRSPTSPATAIPACRWSKSASRSTARPSPSPRTCIVPIGMKLADVFEQSGGFCAGAEEGPLRRADDGHRRAGSGAAGAQKHERRSRHVAKPTPCCRSPRPASAAAAASATVRCA